MTRSPVLDQIRSLGSNKRGGVSILMAMSIAVLIGVAALGTEAGSWYLIHRRAQNAADAAAFAAVLELAEGADADMVRQAGVDLAARNGFAIVDGTEIIVETPPSSGAQAGNSAAAEVIIRQTRPLILAGLFLSSPPTISARAVASVEGTAEACALALEGGLLMGGNSFSSGPNCTLGSNAAGPSSIAVSGSADVVAYSLSAAGGCSGCSSAQVQLSKPYAEYQLPISNPYEALDQKSFSPSCRSPVPNSGVIEPTGLASAFCSSMVIGSQTTADFRPGTYLFKNASFEISGGATVRCSECVGGQGVTFIFTGDPALIGGVKINGNAEVNLKAPTPNPDDPDFSGVLFYRDNRATTNDVSSPAVSINGGSSSILSGAMYFPSSYVKFSGNADIQFSSCTALVGRTLDFTGSAATHVDVSGCDDAGVQVPRVQVVRLVE